MSTFEEAFEELKAIEPQLLAVQRKFKTLPGWLAVLGVELVEDMLVRYGDYKRWSEKTGDRRSFPGK